MKKLLTAVSVLAITVTMQAATLSWGVGELLSETDGIVADGNYAQAGTYAALIYLGRGVDASSYQVAWDKASSSWSVSTDGSAWSAANVIDSYTMTEDDYNDIGGFIKVLDGVGMSFQGDVYSSWEDLNSMGLMMVTVTTEDGTVDFLDLNNAHYNIMVGSASKYSTATGDKGVGYFNADTFDASAGGSVPIVPVPEPSTTLMALAGAMMLVRRKRG